MNLSSVTYFFKNDVTIIVNVYNQGVPKYVKKFQFEVIQESFCLEISYVIFGKLEHLFAWLDKKYLKPC